MKNYDKHIEEITELKNLIVGQKDEKIGDLNTKFKDQDEEIKKMKKILDIIKNETRKNTEKYYKYVKENATIEYKSEIESITNEIRALTGERLRHVGTELIYFENEKLKKEIDDLKANETNNDNIISSTQSNLFETKLQEQINECISDRDEITKSVKQYIESFESGDMLKSLETQIDKSIREH
jgi:hypothetical protein